MHEHGVTTRDTRERGTLLTCPDCWGVLSLRVEGSGGHLYFRCQIGHGFSIESLVAAKEQQLEDRLWSVVLTYLELIRMLEEFEPQLEHLVKDPSAIAERKAGAGQDIETVRHVAESNDPIVLADDRDRRRGRRA